VRREDLDPAWALGGQIDSVLVSAKDPEAARRALTGLFPGAMRVENAAAAREQFRQLMGLGWLMVALMLAFGGVLSGAILFNTATLTVLEHQRDLSTRRALGQTMREVAAQVTAEHAVLTALGCLLGLPLALLCGKALLSAFDSELFSLPFVVRPATVAVTLGGVVAVVLLAQWPALRRVARLDLAEAVRVREG
jgi:putative ABC transport system permease protein